MSPHFLHGEHDGQVGEKGLDLHRIHVAWMSLMVEEDGAFDPIDVGPFRPLRVMQEPHVGGNPIEQFRRLRWGGCPWRIHENLLAMARHEP